MAFKVELTVEGKTFVVRRYYAVIFREDDKKGRPKSDPAWRLYVVIDSLNDTTITNWMLDPKKLVDGKLSLYKIGDGSKVKDIEFKKSSCTFLNDHFNIEQPFITSYVAISGKDIKINTAELQQSWPGA
ncbi:MAG: hypothetical protein C4308_09600 [Chitinophagaceae bacterium]